MITLSEIINQDKRPKSCTVYMTCYNHGKYLDEAIQGVLKQKTNFPVNIVIHDDASTDNGAEIIRKYAAENPSILAIIEETNFIQNGKFFFPLMIPHLTGKYLAYCECDDFWIDENKLQIQVDYLENNPDCIGVYSNTLPVNKFSQYDESVRIPVYKKRGEGDYPRRKILGVQHQIASCVIRNFWPLMKPEDINFYVNLKSIGDQKLIALLLHLGRVHYFSQEFAAYRHVTDEGDSYSARIAKKTPYELYVHTFQSVSNIYCMLKKFFGKNYYRKYFYVLLKEVEGRAKFHRSVIKDSQADSCYELKNIPFFIYLAFPFYYLFHHAYMYTRKLAKKILKALKII